MAGDKTTESAPRKRALVSCDRCKLRRARCIRDNPDEPCADCKVSGVQCESKLPRKQRVYGSVETLSLRYRALESLVKGLFPEENTQDVNVLFKIAASRNIVMPANDDYTAADIFHNTSNQRPLPQPQPRLQPSADTPQSVQLPFPNTKPVPSSGHALAATSPASSTKEHNPFLEVQPTPRHTEELVPTRSGVPHYFGPSSSFRLAMTIRSLVARCKPVSGGDFPSLQPSDLANRSSFSFHHGNPNRSDEEYTLSNSEDPSSEEQKGRKRSRAQMEGPKDRWQHPDGSPKSDTIGDVLPSRSLAEHLVSAYFDHVHVHLPLFHRSMFQFQLESTYSRKNELLKDCADIGWLVALALVFSFGCQQLQEYDPEQAHKLRMKYLSFARTYFQQLSSTASLVNVQALVLLNVHHHIAGEKSSSWLLIGLAAQMAITMGMHRDSPNMEFDTIERNTRRQVWWSIYTFEKILCSILGRPTVIDDREMSAHIPDASSLEQKSMPADLMELNLQVTRMSYAIRQRAYFDEVSAQERSPTLAVANSLLRECDEFFAKIPVHLSLDFSPAPPDQRARILLLHIYYLYMRCIVTRDFLIQKVERNICNLENKTPPPSEDWMKCLHFSEDCVESAHKSIQCIMEGSHLGVLGYSWLDLFFVFHSVLIVCADFLARPKSQADTPKDTERKEMVRAVINCVRGMKQLAHTYSYLGQIAMRFASITGIVDDSTKVSPSLDPSLEPAVFEADKAAERLTEIPDLQEDWFANATKHLGLDFFDLHQAASVVPPPVATNAGPAGFPGYYIDPTSGDDWRGRGMHPI